MSQTVDVATTPKTSQNLDAEHRRSKKRKQHERDSQSAAAGDADTPSTHKKKRRRHEEAVVDDNPEQEPASPPAVATNQDAQNPRATTIPPSTGSATPSPSPFFQQTTSFYLPLSPIGQLHPLESICAEHLSPLLLTYYPPLKGIVISYENARFTNNGSSKKSKTTTPILAKSISEYAVSFAWVTADFTIFTPVRGASIEGHITVQSRSHVGLLCWNLFNASIEQMRLPRSWRWMEGPSGNGRRRSSVTTNDDGVIEGHFVGADGSKVDGGVKFRVRNFETGAQDLGRGGGYMSIEGTLLTDEEEQKLAATEAAVVVDGIASGPRGMKQ